MSGRTNSQKASILVVDSDPNELKTLAIGLELEGFAVITADTSQRAIELVQTRSCQLALVDLMMPQMNGLQLARAMKSNRPDVSTILMSAYHLSPLQLSRADTGAVGFVPKPFRFDELVQFITRKLQSGSDAAPAPAPKDNLPADDGLHSPFDVPRSA